MRTWGSVPVRGTPLVNCGAPASQTHIGTVVGSGHESYSKNAGRKGIGSRAIAGKDKIVASVSEL
jgi:hypothetical protein